MSRAVALPILNPATDMRQLIAFAKYPIFPLAPGQRRIEYKDRIGNNSFYFFVTSDEASHVPTISDSDILIYVASQLTASFNRGAKLSAEIPFRPNNVLRFLGRATGGRQRSLLADSLRRLERANFTGSIPLGPYGNLLPGTLIEHLDWPEGEELPRVIQVPTWMLHQVQQKQILKIAPASLRLRGLERRINEWAWAHASKATISPWSIKLSYAWLKAGGVREPGSGSHYRKFKFALRRLVERNALPGYHLSLTGTARDECLSILRITHNEFGSMPEPRETLEVFLDLPNNQEW